MSEAPEDPTALRDDLLRWMRSPATGEFEGMACRVLRFQARENPVYRALLASRGLEARSLARWEDFPPLPTRAFREFRVYAGPDGSEEETFRTSGTTGGDPSGTLRGAPGGPATGARGVHRVRDRGLYHASLLLQGARSLRPPRPLRVLALLPSPSDRPDSSLVHMAGVFGEHWGDGRGGFFAGPDWTLAGEAFEGALREAARERVPVLLVGTAFAWVHWLDRRDGVERARTREAGATGAPSSGAPSNGIGEGRGLAPGSLLVETGGFKGRSREVGREPLYEALSRALGIPRSRMVNEYGMTELLSQFYEPIDALEPDGSLAGRHHEGPHWVRTRVLDPVTLEPVAPGTPGLLCHLDLANLFSASHLLTEDLGTQVAPLREGSGTAFRLLGRRPGAEPRGCSLVMEELLGVVDG